MPILSSAAPPAADPAPVTQSTAISAGNLEEVVKELKGRILGLYYLETTGEFVVNYGGESIKKGATLAGTLGAAKANRDALAARRPTTGG